LVFWLLVALIGLMVVFLLLPQGIWAPVEVVPRA
jgi:hypothetical protein